MNKFLLENLLHQHYLLGCIRLGNFFQIIVLLLYTVAPSAYKIGSENFFEKF